MDSKASLKFEILEVLEDCISILSRGENGVDEYEYRESKARLECARALLDASKIYFQPVVTNRLSIH